MRALAGAALVGLARGRMGADPGAQGPVRVAVGQLATSKAGYDTYRVSVEFQAEHVLDVYALYGQAGDELIVPPAYQSPTPFGTNVGPVNPAFFAVNADCEFDSYLTVGVDRPALVPGSLSSVGLDFGSWSETQGMVSENGAVFYMDPDHGATVEPVVFMQLTVPAGSRFQGQLSAQGRTVGGGTDWTLLGQRFDERGAVDGLRIPPDPGKEPPPPPPAPAPASSNSGAGGAGGPGEVTVVVNQLAASKAGSSTYQVGVEFDERRVKDVYALFGQPGDPLIIPPAYQAPVPCGSNVGPVDPSLLATHPDCLFDSFLTIGMDGPALIAADLSSVGLDFGSWTATQGISSEEGAVFYKDQERGATVEPVVFMQLTVPAGSSFRGKLSAQGRMQLSAQVLGSGTDWTLVGEEFSLSAGAAPPPAPVAVCPGDPDLVISDGTCRLCVS